MMYKKILVPLDGSSLAEKALAPAAKLAQTHGASLLLVSVPHVHHVFVQEPHGMGFMSPQNTLPDDGDVLADYLATIAARPLLADLVVDHEVIGGDVASVIVDTAVTQSVDLIVMTTHGYSGVTRWVMGSVAERVTRAAMCDVLVIRGDERLERLLIPLDGSALAEASLAVGTAVATAFGSERTLLQVVVPAVDVASAAIERAALLQGNWEGSDQFIRQRAIDYLKEVRQHEDLADCHYEAVLDVGAASGIVNYVEAKEVDLIVMTTHGYSGLKRWFYGSVTEKVIRSAPCAVLVVHVPHEQLKDVSG